MARKALAALATSGLAMAGLVVFGPVRASAATPQENPVVAVVLDDPRGVVTRSDAYARELVEGIYGAAGVTVVWGVPSSGDFDRRLTVTFVTTKSAPRGISPEAMGVAPSPGDGTRGTQAYVFMDRVETFAAEHQLALASVLACAIAHEVGHLLLPPNAHVPSGVMRGGWYPSLFPPKAPGLPGFPPDQGRLLRLRARRQ